MLLSKDLRKAHKLVAQIKELDDTARELQGTVPDQVKILIQTGPDEYVVNLNSLSDGDQVIANLLKAFETRRNALIYELNNLGVTYENDE